MQQLHASFWNLGKDLRLLAPSAVLGVAAGLFINGYWLADILPPESKMLVGFTVLAAILAAAGYWLLLAWMHIRLRELRIVQRLVLAALAVPTAAFLFFGGTSEWRVPERYVTFLLPAHTLEISALPSAAPNKTALAWFSTSLGDVSYDEIESDGWQRRGDEFVLQNPAVNDLKWVGKTGEKALLVFHASSTDAQVRVSWDHQSEILSLSGKGLTPVHAFDIPFYASRTAIVLLGLANCYLLWLACLLVLWQNRAKLGKALEDSMPRVLGPLDGRDAALMGGSLLLAVLLRGLNLGNVFPAVDEYYHLIAAKQIIAGAPLFSVYARGLWLVTIPVSGALLIFGHQLWAARLVGVVFNSLAIVPLYLLARRINRPVAALACVLYATSPWIITFARVAREYAYYPFYFLWILYGMVLVIDGMPPRFVFHRQWRALLRPRTLLVGAALSLPPVFALSVDWLSTFRTILIAYLVFGVFVLVRFNWKEKANWPILALLFAGVVKSGWAWYQEQSDKILPVPRLNTIPIEYFLPNPQQQWYFNRAGIVMVLSVLGAIALAFLIRRLNFIPLFIIALFGSYLAVFVLISKTFFHPRHLLSTELWYVAVAAIGLYAMWGTISLLSPWPRMTAGLLSAGLLALSFLNPQQILLPSVSSNPDMPISEDYLHDLSQVQAFMIANAAPGDVLVSTVYGLYTTWEGQPAFAAQYRITTRTPESEVLSIAEGYPSGWIVVDEIRLKQASRSLRDFAGHDGIQYVGLFGDEYVWHWQRASGQAREPSYSGRGR